LVEAARLQITSQNLRRRVRPMGDKAPKDKEKKKKIDDKKKASSVKPASEPKTAKK